MNDDIKEPGTAAPAEEAAEPSGIAGRLKALVRRLKVEAHVLYLAFRHARTPWYAKAILVLVLLYALSPIDIIPDIIPILGMLDDLVILSLGIWISVRLIPKDVMAECREQAEAADRPDWVRALWQKLKDM
jgi:uncharacterized membrane protein YkvA (DUF1232 family)